MHNKQTPGLPSIRYSLPFQMCYLSYKNAAGTELGEDMRTVIAMYVFSPLTDANLDLIDPTVAFDQPNDLVLCQDRKSTRLNSSHSGESRMPSSA